MLLLSRRSVLLLSLARLPVISAQITRADFPECALPCVDNAVQQATDCAIDDFACYCEPANNALIVTSATPCVVKQCDAANVPRTINVSKGLCTPGNRNPAGGVVGNGGANAGNGTGTDATPSSSRGTPAFDIPEPTVTSLEGELIDQYGASASPSTPSPSQSVQAALTPKTGLPAGAKAGIAIGVIVAVFGCALAAFLFRRRKHRRTYKSSDILNVLNDSEDLDMAEIAKSMQEAKYSEMKEPVEVDGSGGRKMSEMNVPPSFVEKVPPGLADGATSRRDSQTLPRTNKDLPSPLSPLDGDEDAASTKNAVGPLPSPLDLFPTQQHTEAQAEAEAETDFAYQRRKLEERRARIEERKRLNEEEEQVAMEEEALRRKEAAKVRRDG